MDKELQDRLRGLQLRLNTLDIFAKNAVCDELLGILKEQDDEHVKNEIRRIIVLPLVDLNRINDLSSCIEAMLAQPDYELNIVALMAREHYLRRLNDFGERPGGCGSRDFAQLGRRIQTDAMIEWKEFGEQPAEETLRNYPTILDIVKDVVALEEKKQIHKLPLYREKNDSFYDWSRTGHYLMLQDRKLGLPVLLPTSRTSLTFYRGQSEYHERCLPSRYRQEGEEREKERLRSYLQTAEMILLMKSHPVIMSIESGGIMHEKLGLMAYGLASRL